MLRSTLAAVLAASLSTALDAQAVWSQLYPPVQPPARSSALMACFEATGATIVACGEDNSVRNDVWRLQGNGWTQLPTAPFALTDSAIVYDSVRQRLVVFGGRSAAGTLTNATWEWDGASWIQVLVATPPSPRRAHAMAFDRARGVTVLYGGTVALVPATAMDTWEYDGTVWTQRAAVSPFGPRTSANLAFDPVRGDVMLFGGLEVLPGGGGQALFNDTWSWNGASWSQRTPTSPPTYRIDPALATDLDRRRVVLHGGLFADSFAWEWDGSEWRIALQASPSEREGGALAYDPAARRLVLFGGRNQYAPFQDTWVYATPLPATVEPFGSGCAGTAGTPQLQHAPYSLPWLGDTFRNVVGAIANGEPGALFVSSVGTTTPVPLDPFGLIGCDLLVPLDVVEFRTAAGGAAEWSVAIPISPSLAATQFRQQAFVFDAGANAFGLAASNAITATLGVR